MAPRTPTEADFPEQYEVRINKPENGKTPSNVLVLLHGLGDSAENFGIFGQRLNLPETVSMAVQAPTPLPFDLQGFHWGDDIIFDQNTGHMDMDTGFEKATKFVRETIIERVLIEKCGFAARQIHLFGYGQGGMVALNTVHALTAVELGGVISIGGAFPHSTHQQSPRCKTPVLVLYGSSKSAISVTNTSRIKDAFEAPSFVQWNRGGDGMPSKREEMLPIMQFFARRLQSRTGVPADAQELT